MTLKPLAAVLILVASALTETVRKPFATIPASGAPVTVVAVKGGIIAIAYGGSNFIPQNAFALFQKVSGQWTQIATLTISNPAAVITSIAITTNYIVAGALTSHGYDDDHGAAYVFVKPPKGWEDTNETAVLLPSNPTPNSGYGYSVAAYGPTVVVGAPGNDTPGDTAYVYQQPTNGWKNATENAQLTCFADSGWSVAVAGLPGHDGSEIAVGGSATVFFFEEPPSGWTDMTQTAYLASGCAGGGPNCPVTMSYNVIAKGLPTLVGRRGGALVYVKPPGGWVTTSSPTATLSDPTARQFLSISITPSGEQIASCCGASYGSSINNLEFLFTEPTSGWTSATSASFKLLGAAGHGQCDGCGSQPFDPIVIGNTGFAIVGGSDGVGYLFGAQ